MESRLKRNPRLSRRRNRRVRSTLLCQEAVGAPSSPRTVLQGWTSILRRTSPSEEARSSQVGYKREADRRLAPAWSSPSTRREERLYHGSSKGNRPKICRHAGQRILLLLKVLLLELDVASGGVAEIPHGRLIEPQSLSSFPASESSIISIFVAMLMPMPINQLFR